MQGSENLTDLESIQDVGGGTPLCGLVLLFAMWFILNFFSSPQFAVLPASDNLPERHYPSPRISGSVSYLSNSNSYGDSQRFRSIARHAGLPDSLLPTNGLTQTGYFPDNQHANACARVGPWCTAG
ncbi:hypothetical protein HBI16_188830 [Parastagonospora nodorum]|nr:hypothetical protein HBI16_188830 [Parastagonospora nodorum]